MRPFDQLTTHSPMKTISSLLAATALCSPSLSAQVSPPAASTGPVSVDAAPHHRTWQTVKVERDDLGRPVTLTDSYVELATGMNLWSETDRNCVAANDEVELLNVVAVAARTQHELRVLPQLHQA